VGGGVRVGAGGHLKKALQQRRHALRNSPNPERERVRENARGELFQALRSQNETARLSNQLLLFE
jgi:hypothetical protein